MQERRRKSAGFERARQWARQTGCRNRAEWLAYCKEQGKPSIIPMHPDRVYAGEFLTAGGWAGFLEQRSHEERASIYETWIRRGLERTFMGPHYRSNSSHRKIPRLDEQGNSIGVWLVDAWLPTCGLIVEYDGHRWHQGKAALAFDQRKNLALHQMTGHLIVRVREPGLTSTSSVDLMLHRKLPPTELLEGLLIHLRHLLLSGIWKWPSTAPYSLPMAKYWIDAALTALRTNPHVWATESGILQSEHAKNRFNSWLPRKFDYAWEEMEQHFGLTDDYWDVDLTWKE